MRFPACCFLVRQLRTEQTNALKHDELFKRKSLLGTVSGPEPLLFFGRIWGVEQEMLKRVD